MFDVIWTDPNRELVGEHRAKKEKKKKNQAQKEQPTLPSRSSLSLRSSRSSIDSPFSLFRSRGHRVASQAGSRTKSSGSSGLAPSILSSQSPLSVGSDASSHRHSVAILDSSDLYSEATRAADPRRRIHRFRDSSDRPVSLSSHETSAFKSSDSSSLVDASVQDPNEMSRWEKSSRLVQTLGPASYITKRTEVSWIPRNAQSDDSGLVTEVLITSEPDMDEFSTPPTSPGNQSLPVPSDKVDSPVNLNPRVKSPSSPESSTWALSFKPNNPDAWRPPDEWDCLPLSPLQVQTPREKLLQDSFPHGLEESATEEPCVALNTLQHEVQRMASTSPSDILSRLREVWDTSGDPSVQEERDTEKKRWMLSVLHHLDPVPRTCYAEESGANTTSKASQKILALWESKATASYLAALHLDKQVYHMSTTPLPHAMFPNMRPVLVRSISPSVFPVAQELFQSVYSLSLPALCSSQDIPGVLRNIHRCLKPHGSLKLTLIDPLPCAGTLGHRLRAWLEEHLLLNLERNFRCTHPSRVFPHWLGDAALRGRGSTLTTAKFYALPASARRGDEAADPDPLLDHARTERETKAELRSLVGRMLWMEVWGPFVTAGGRWWWEDAACVDECRHLGTFWEYSMIEGVKDTQRPP